MISALLRRLFILAACLLAASAARAQTLVPQEQAIANYMASNPGQGRPELILDPVIEAVARARARDMAVRNYFSHVDPDGVAANYLLRAAGYILPAWWGTDPTANYVESIAAGYSDPGDTWTAWMNSPDHKVHLLGQNSFYATETHYGVGYYYDANSTYKYYWVVITAPPQPLEVSTPTPRQIVNSASIPVAGTTDPSTSPATVQFRVENSAGIGDYQPATGLASWSGTATLVSGTNIIRVQSLDGSGNVIAQVARPVTYVVVGTLTVSVSGSGSVTSGYLGSTTRDVGPNITIRPIPAPGSIFIGWTGSILSASTSLTFSMQDGLNLQANFEPNPYGPAVGAYYGLLTSGSAPAGIVRFTLSSMGSFTGSIRVDGTAYAFSTLLSPSGSASVTIHRAGSTPLSVALQTSLTSPGEITGTVSDGTDTFTFTAGQSIFNAKTNAAPQAGRYTLVLPPDPTVTGSAAPQGSGYAVMTVGVNGATSIAGRLADGAIYTASTYVANDGSLALFAIPSGSSRGSSLNGLLTFRSTTISDLDGTLAWTSAPRSSAGSMYPAGFSVSLASVGSRYIPPTAGLQPMDVAPGAATAGFASGDLLQPLDVPVSITPSDSAVMTTPGLPHLTLSINPANGYVSGRFLLPGGTYTRTIGGVVLQKQQSAYGFFLGPTQSGYFALTPGS